MQKTSQKVIDILNEALTGELTAVNQYVLHSSICKNWGYNKLAKTMYDESIEEMKHAQTLIDRVLYLEGLPNLQKLNPLNIGETVPEQFEADLELERKAITHLRESIPICRAEGDVTSANILEEILKDEENHYDWLEAQIEMTRTVGVENYLAQQM